MQAWVIVTCGSSASERPRRISFRRAGRRRQKPSSWTTPLPTRIPFSATSPFKYYWDFPRVGREYKIGREFDPALVHQWYGFFLLALNQLPEADIEFKK